MSTYIIYTCILVVGINIGFVLGCMWASHRGYKRGYMAASYNTESQLLHEYQQSAYQANQDYPE